jgi:hypothetical protein
VPVDRMHNTVRRSATATASGQWLCVRPAGTGEQLQGSAAEVGSSEPERRHNHLGGLQCIARQSVTVSSPVCCFLLCCFLKCRPRS